MTDRLLSYVGRQAMPIHFGMYARLIEITDEIEEINSFQHGDTGAIVAVPQGGVQADANPLLEVLVAGPKQYLYARALPLMTDLLEAGWGNLPEVRDHNEAVTGKPFPADYRGHEVPSDVVDRRHDPITAADFTSPAPARDL